MDQKAATVAEHSKHRIETLAAAAETHFGKVGGELGTIKDRMKEAAVKASERTAAARAALDALHKRVDAMAKADEAARVKARERAGRLRTKLSEAAAKRKANHDAVLAKLKGVKAVAAAAAEQASAHFAKMEKAVAGVEAKIEATRAKLRAIAAKAHERAVVAREARAKTAASLRKIESEQKEDAAKASEFRKTMKSGMENIYAAMHSVQEKMTSGDSEVQHVIADMHKQMAGVVKMVRSAVTMQEDERKVIADVQLSVNELKRDNRRNNPT